MSEIDTVTPVKINKGKLNLKWNWGVTSASPWSELFPLPLPSMLQTDGNPLINKELPVLCARTLERSMHLYIWKWVNWTSGRQSNWGAALSPGNRNLKHESSRWHCVPMNRGCKERDSTHSLALVLPTVVASGVQVLISQDTELSLWLSLLPCHWQWYQSF